MDDDFKEAIAWCLTISVVYGVMLGMWYLAELLYNIIS